MNPDGSSPGRHHRASAPAAAGNRYPLADSVYLKIKAAIIHNDLQPGSQIAEQQIAAELEVSRTPVHQAIVRLENEGWLKLQPKRGIVIKIRAGYSSAVLTKEIISACVELEHRGLAQHCGSRVRSKSRWRRLPDADHRAVTPR